MVFKMNFVTLANHSLFLVILYLKFVDGG